MLIIIKNHKSQKRRILIPYKQIPDVKGSGKVHQMEKSSLLWNELVIQEYGTMYVTWG